MTNHFCPWKWRSLPYGEDGREEVSIMRQIRHQDAINSVMSRYAKYSYQY